MIAINYYNKQFPSPEVTFQNIFEDKVRRALHPKFRILMAWRIAFKYTSMIIPPRKRVACTYALG